MRILVAHASGYGATVEVAREVATVLSAEHDVDIKETRQVRSLAPYDAVVVGSSLRADRWLPSMVGFLGRFRKQLATKPLAIYTVCLTARTLEGSRRVLRESQPKLLKRFPELQPISSEAFGGVLDYHKYSTPVRMIMRKVANQEGLPTSGMKDYRDWQAIREWARSLSRQFVQAQTPDPSPDRTS